MEQTNQNSPKASIRASMQEKDTEELLAIWQAGDTREWTEETFKVVDEILLERLGSLPERGTADEPIDADDEEYEPYHDPEAIEKIAMRAGQLAIWFLIGAILLIVYVIIILVSGVIGQQGAPSSQLVLAYFSTISLYFVRVLVCIFCYLALKAIEEGLYLLMDIEDHTRGKKR